MTPKKQPWHNIVLICALTLLMAVLPSQAQQKSTLRDNTPQLFISTAPQHLLFGLNLGLERSLSSKVSIGADLTAHLWLLEMPNIAVTPMVKYYFSGIVGMGFYARAKAIGGILFPQIGRGRSPLLCRWRRGHGTFLPPRQVRSLAFWLRCRTLFCRSLWLGSTKSHEERRQLELGLL